MRPRFWPTLLLLLCVRAPGATAQDVEWLGERYGTRPPEAYFLEMGTDEGAFEFERGWSARVSAASRRSTPSGAQLALGPRSGPVLGTFWIPVILGLYENSGELPPIPRADVQAAYFSDTPGTVPVSGTITEFYDEVSGGRVELLGDVRDWVRASMTQSEVTGGDSGLNSGTGEFIKELLALQTGVDWAQFDNDGPDGVPNSGDDDGFVDVLALLHPTKGAECGGVGSDNRIWSHRWSLRSATGGDYRTTTPAFGGGVIRIDDYVVQPIFSCDPEPGSNGLNEIGVFTHELGHAFGLPDLYDTNGADGKHGGAGNWALMSSGSWGCDNNSPAMPCHLGAWSKAVLGWADVTTLPAGVDLGTLTLAPVETSGTVYRIDAQDGSGEYFLLENRQRIGYDQNLHGEGMLVWHVDPDWVEDRWSLNRVNAAAHRGVWLRQADGLDELGATTGGNRGDDGDPFPFVQGPYENREFHAGSEPASRSYPDDTSTGLTITDVTRIGDDVSFRISTRFTSVSVRAAGASETAGLFTVDGESVDPVTNAFDAAPFEQHVLEAAAGETVSEGVRVGFRQWADDPAQDRSRSIVVPLDDVEFVAEYGGRQIEFRLSLSGGVGGVEPGSIFTDPSSEDLWFEEGSIVSVQVVPQTGFSFLGWTGDLSGQPNPTSVTFDAPVAAGADFELIFEVASTSIDFPAIEEQDLQLEVESGTSPVSWRLVGGDLPAGMSFASTGRIRGTALDTGAFPLTLEARDAIGLVVDGVVTLNVLKPELSIERIASFFLLTGTPLEGIEMTFLDQQGNADGGYDLGDFRAWVLDNPALPLSASVTPVAAPRTIVLPVRAGAGSEPR